MFSLKRLYSSVIMASGKLARQPGKRDLTVYIVIFIVECTKISLERGKISLTRTKISSF